MKAGTLSQLHPFVVFWIGVLTGALVVGFVFLYKALNENDYKNALLNLKTTYSTGLNLKGAALDTTSIGTPNY